MLHPKSNQRGSSTIITDLLCNRLQDTPGLFASVVHGVDMSRVSGQCIDLKPWKRPGDSWFEALSIGAIFATLRM
jgi:hypothetical protein